MKSLKKGDTIINSPGKKEKVPFMESCMLFNPYFIGKEKKQQTDIQSKDVADLFTINTSAIIYTGMDIMGRY